MSDEAYLFFFLDLKIKTSGLNGGENGKSGDGGRTTAKPLMTFIDLD